MTRPGEGPSRGVFGLFAAKAGGAGPIREPASGSDPVSSAVRRGVKRGAPELEPPPWVFQRVRQAREEAGNAALGPRAAEPALSQVLDLVAHYPRSEALQIEAARIVEATCPAAEAARVWSGIVERFPITLDAFRVTLRQFVKMRGRNAVVQETEELDFESGGLLSVGLRKAVALEELTEFDAADRVFSLLVERFGSVEVVHTEYCRSLIGRRLYLRALTALNAALARFPDHTWFRANQREVNLILADFELVAPGILGREGPLSGLLIENLLENVAAERAAARTVPKPYLGPTVLVTATLGLGGAERQLATTATALARAAQTGASIAGRPVLGPITVCVRDLNPAKGHDFFLSDLRAAGVMVEQYLAFPPSGGDARASLVTRYRTILKFLPNPMSEGMLRLLDWFTWQKPDAVQIWQDGMVYATALAAVLAGVPRIVLSHRTLPPIDRRERHKAEHETLYRTLARLPGISLTTNSLVAARRFEEWLGLEPGLVGTIPNGVVLPPSAPSDAVRERARAFFEATGQKTGDDAFTVGGVMRLDENKRPLEWVDVAIGLLKRVPKSRFIVVGDGPLLASMKDYVRLRGFVERFLFVGRSHDVRFWLGQMDVLLALSRFEGLPNAVIEAQIAGVPVVATPAGGTREAIAPDSTGLLLPRADTVEIDEAVARLVRLAEHPEIRRPMAEAGRRWAQDTFSVDRMIARTARVMLGEEPA